MTEITTHALEAKYQPVFDAFKKNFDLKKERGAQLCVFKGGKKVIDLVGARKTKNYDSESNQVVMSSGKVVTSLVAAYFVDKGWINYEDSLSKFMPGFLEHHTENLEERKGILVEDLLRHDAGLGIIDSLKNKISFELVKDEKKLLEYLNKQKLSWNLEVLKKNAKKRKVPAMEYKERAYHSTNRGFYMNQVFTTAHPDSLSFGQILRKELIPKLQTPDKVSICCGDFSEEELKHVCRGNFDSPTTTVYKLLRMKMTRSTHPLLKKVFKVAGSKHQKFSSESFDMKPERFHPGMLSIEAPSFNVFTSARSLATFGNAMVFKNGEDGPILSDSIRKTMFSDPISKFDWVSGCTTRFDKGGFAHFSDSDLALEPCFEGFVGWGGFGGSLFVFHPELEIVFAYTPSYRLSLSLAGFNDARCLRIFQALVKVTDSEAS